MVSNKQKGRAFEMRVMKYLQSIGYSVDRARPALKFVGPGKYYCGPNDFWGCADLIAFRKDKPFVLVLQVHAGSSISPRQRKLEALPWHPTAQRVQLWVKQPSFQSGIRSLWLDNGTWKEYIWRLKDGQEPVGGLL